MKQPICEYECQQCHYKFQREKPGPVNCEACGYHYVNWTNAIEVLNYLQLKSLHQEQE